jgi:hypothetical protein
VLVKPEGLYVNHTDAAIRSRTAKYFVDLVNFCAGRGWEGDGGGFAETEELAAGCLAGTGFGMDRGNRFVTPCTRRRRGK